MHASPQTALLLTRVGFGVFLLTWGLNKVVRPEATARIFDTFYHIGAISPSISIALGFAQVALSLAIIAGLYKSASYGIGVVIHGASTAATTPHLLLPFAEGSNLLFMAAVPVLLSAIGLFLAREADTLLSLDTQLRGARSVGYGRQSS